MISVDRNNYLLFDFSIYITLQFEYYVESHKITMKQIPSDLKARYSSMLVQKEVPEKYHYYGKWLRYYLDFCEKYRFNQLNKESLVHFIKIFCEKRQNDQQQKQEALAIFIFYKIRRFKSNKKIPSIERIGVSPTKKEHLKPTGADWKPVYMIFALFRNYWAVSVVNLKKRPFLNLESLKNQPNYM
jgi:hypothetical protein